MDQRGTRSRTAGLRQWLSAGAVEGFLPKRRMPHRAVPTRHTGQRSTHRIPGSVTHRWPRRSRGHRLRTGAAGLTAVHRQMTLRRGPEARAASDPRYESPHRPCRGWRFVDATLPPSRLRTEDRATPSGEVGRGSHTSDPFIPIGSISRAAVHGSAAAASLLSVPPVMAMTAARYPTADAWWRISWTSRFHQQARAGYSCAQATPATGVGG